MTAIAIILWMEDDDILKEAIDSILASMKELKDWKPEEKDA